MIMKEEMAASSSSSSSSSYAERMAKACREMKDLYGIQESRVRSALNDLLRLYENSWSLIEENNYEVLLESALNDSKQEVKKEEEEDCNLHKKKEKSNQVESMLGDEHGKIPTTLKQSSTFSQLRDSGNNNPSKRARLSQSDARTSPAIAEAVSNGVPIIDVERNVVISLHEPSQGQENVPKYKPLAIIHPDSSKNLESRPQLMHAKSKLDIVSSNDGKSKISLICDPSFSRGDLHQRLDTTLEMVEEKLRTRYGIKNTKFSIKKVLKEFCNCYMEISTKCTENAAQISSMGKLEGFCTLNCTDNSFINDRCCVGNLSIENKNKKGKIAKGKFSKSSSMEGDQIQNPNFVEDISRGEEQHPICLVNENGALELPKFFYIATNVVFNNAYLNFSLARISDANCCSNCSGNCLLEPANCACTSETRGEFAYTLSGLLKERFLDACIDMNRRRPTKDHLYFCENCPLENIVMKNGIQRKRKRSRRSCKGHLMRKFIKECWVKCGCSRKCGNRVVQRGIIVKLQIFPTPQGKGWGVRTLEPLEKGTFVCEYVGEIVTNLELHERNIERAGKKHTYPVLLDADWAAERHLKDEEALCLDATKFGNVARFINHRCHDANLIEIPVEVETPDHHYYHLAFFTTRKIEAFEELTWDYGIDFDDETHPIKAFECKCGSDFCGMKTGS